MRCVKACLLLKTSNGAKWWKINGQPTRHCHLLRCSYCSKIPIRQGSIGLFLALFRCGGGGFDIDWGRLHKWDFVSVF